VDNIRSSLQRHAAFVIRIIIALLVAGVAYAQQASATINTLAFGALGYALALCLIAAAADRYRHAGPIIPTLKAAADIFVVTMLIALLEETGIALISAYALIIISLGQRWGGQPALYAALMSAGGIIFLALQHPLWANNPALCLISFFLLAAITYRSARDFNTTKTSKTAASQRAERETQPRIAEGGDGEMAVKGLRILVGEDDPTYQKLILRILEHNAHHPDVVSNGERVLDAVESTDYDLLILDIHMPKMGGLEAAKLFRFLRPDRRRIPIIMLTADPGQDTGQECADAGVNAFLSKPVQPQQLLRVISRLAISQGRWQSTASLPAVPLQIVRTNGNKGEILDYALLEEVAELSNDPQFLQDLFDGFVHDSRMIIIKLRQVAQLGEYGQLIDDAQALMGSARSLGATALADVCDQAIRTAESSRPDCVDDGIADLKRVFDKTKDALAEFLDHQRQQAQSDVAS
jgi:CheY-like chemotaxis protein